MIAVSLGNQSCTAFNQSNEDEEKISQEADYDDDEPSTLYPHPKSATAWSTKVLVLTNQLPQKEKIQGCQQQLQVVAKPAKNPDAILTTQSQTEIEVKQNQELYHWCFFQTMVELDDALLNDHMTMSFAEKNAKFYNTMKVLWLLATTLDTIEEQGTYFKYLRKRYIDLNNEFFARNVDTLGSPLHLLKTGESDFMDDGAFTKEAKDADVDL